MQFKIVHTADIQVQSREKNLSISYNKCLQDIEDNIIKLKAEIYLITGDLFEYAISNETEKKLMYQHLSRVLTIDTLKEVVIMAGNHDLEKINRKKENEEEENSINTFAETINALGDQYAKKLNYLKYSKPTPSIATDKLVWLPYSLEDGLAIRSSAADTVKALEESGKCVVTLYHDILKEYVDETKLPVQKSKYETLCGMSDFHTPLTIAGDIHLNWNYASEDGKRFYYCGSPIQRNFGEGSYFKVGEKVMHVAADKKVVKVFIFDSDSLKIQFCNDLAINDYVAYNTIETLLNVKPENLFDNIDTIISNIKFGKEQTFIKFKLSNVFISYELELRKLMFEKTSDYKRVNIDVSYDKFVNTNDHTNVERILATTTGEESIETNEQTSQESLDVLTDTPTLDNLILTDIQLKKLFTYTLDERMNKLIKEYGNDKETLSLIYGKILDTFVDELSNCINQQTRLNIELQSIKCNMFMSLGENDIVINAPGITRISATNAVGKTTLFHMIRWTIRGELYEGMNRAQVKKNTLLVFNNKRGDLDDLTTQLKLHINNSDITITRFASRTWKRGVTEEQKIALNWRDFIQTVTMSVKLHIHNTVTNKEQELVGDAAQQYINTWFGDAPETIMFVNYVKILQTLGMPSKELNQIILNFIGVDYLDKLEINLPIIKDSLMVEKPKRSKEEIMDDIKQADNTIAETDKSITENTARKNEIDEKHTVLNEELSSVHSELEKLGDVNENISIKTRELGVVENTIRIFEIQEKKEKPQFERVIPQAPDTSTMDNRIEELNVRKTETETSFNATQTQITELKSELESNYVNIIETVTNAKTAIESKINELISTRTQAENSILVKQEEIKSGVCPTCKRPYDDAAAFEEKKNHLLSEIESLKQEVNETSQLIESQRYKVELIKVKIEKLKFNYKLVCSLNLSATTEDNDDRNVMINNLKTLAQKCDEIKVSSATLNDEIRKQQLEKDAATAKYTSELKSYNDALLLYNKECNEIDAYNAKVDEQTLQLSQHKTTHALITKDIETLRTLLPLYEATKEKQTKLKGEIAEVTLQQRQTEEITTRLAVEKTNAQNKKQNLETEYNNCLRYQINNQIYKVYSQIITSDFKQIVFEYYRNFLNNSLNVLLEDVNFKLFFNNDSDLYMISLKDGVCSYTPCQQVSGMESVFMGLSLIYMMSVLNIKNSISLICIDELSGQLNDGKNLTYDAPDYCELFVKIVNKFKEKNVLIVDHQIKDMFETLKYEVRETENGGKYFVI